jgi:aryl-alcohol dehydrogenase-like predicted oxidoreductase
MALFSTMTFGLDTTDMTASAVRTRGVENIRPILEVFRKHGHVDIDTARRYGHGETEKVGMRIFLPLWLVAYTINRLRRIPHFLSSRFYSRH